ncbi:MAG: biotin--[acetyl-CoA-carboxylase] ligase [Senegalia sp. (in: firmicutes)]|uniref:biotin--[acetyl-CoA-carboxylase] ligase n=1 Tax=Senegalia sp. (in: firmicutes) TaxID=1924098 RepID=UPI003F954EB3
MKNKIIEVLKENKNEYISGEVISEMLNVSRTSIWKYISKLREEGYIIESASRKGYRLVSSPDILDIDKIKKSLTTKYIGRDIYYYNSIDSTNKKAKNLAMNENKEAVIISEEQTMGKGRLGRNWISPKYKGIWMSIILKPEIAPEEAPKITQIAAAAVSKVLDDINIENKIKWPNDIVINKKKVCGILTEMNGEIDKINFIVIGIGINVNLEEKDLSPDIKDIATSLKIESKIFIDRANLVKNILNEFEYLYEDFLNSKSMGKSLEICRRKSALLGKTVRLINVNETKKVKAVDIDSEGRLIIEDEFGKIKRIISGEISIRGLNDYV